MPARRRALAEIAPRPVPPIPRRALTEIAPNNQQRVPPPPLPLPRPRRYGQLPYGFTSKSPRVPADDQGVCDKVCEYCEARYWIGETNSSRKYTGCCSNGDVDLPRWDNPPSLLWRLFTDQNDPLAVHFQKNTRAYNAALSFTSISYTPDRRLQGRGGIHVFAIQGQLFNLQGPLEAQAGQCPRGAQWLFYDPQEAIRGFTGFNPDLKPRLLSEIMELLTQTNQYVPLYKTARELLQDSPVRANTDVYLNPELRLIVRKGADTRRENLPTTNEVAGLILDESRGPGEMILAPRGSVDARNPCKRVPHTSPAYMPLAYVLFFPRGEPGWHPQMRYSGVTGRKRTKLPEQVYYRHRIHPRQHENSLLFYGRRLFQQLLVNFFVVVELSRLEYIRYNQESIRADAYDQIPLDSNITPANQGRRVVLPASFTAGDRYMQHIYQDAMAILRFLGVPDLFITFTANPNWPEIVRELLSGQTVTDRPDLVDRVFKLKLDALLQDLKKGCFGPFTGTVWVIEYQKRGLPHAHILLFLGHSKPDYMQPDNIDQIISAELPDPETDPELYGIITTNMLHGPCGPDFLGAPCMTRKEFGHSQNSCAKRFPRPFCSRTKVTDGGYPEYRRREQCTPVERGPAGNRVRLDNRWVVPYSPFLSRKYNAHINVELCGGVHAIKYIFKYVCKGADQVSAELRESPDEVARYLSARYIGPHEAFWRMMEYPTHGQWPPVTDLGVHLEGQQVVYFPDGISSQELALRKETTRTPLMAFFQYNTDNPQEAKRLFTDFPRTHVWNKKHRIWTRRKTSTTAIGRLHWVSPVAGEKYYLRLLLTVVPGPKSFTDLRTFQGHEYSNFRAACVARGLAEDDREWYHCFDEAGDYSPATSLRFLFLTGLRSQLITDPLTVWLRYRDCLTDDLLRRLERFQGRFPLVLANPVYDYGLYLLGASLAKGDLTLSDFSLPTPTFDWSVLESDVEEAEERAQSLRFADEMRAHLNEDQSVAFRTITQAIIDDPQTAHLFLQGPGGTGKTFLYRTLYHYYRSLGKRVLCVASTGIAAQLLPCGRTSHSSFKIPIELTDVSCCNVTKNQQLGRRLRNVDLIIWDEVTMQHKHCFGAVNRLLNDLRTDSSLSQRPGRPVSPLFGGIPVVFGGDWAQILPVVRHGERPQIVDACFQRSSIWPHIKRLFLRKNMRVRSDATNGPFIKWISDLPYSPEYYGPGKAALPEYVSKSDRLQDLLSSIYPPTLLERAKTDWTVFRSRTILTTLNTAVTDLNTRLLDQFGGEERVYEGINTAELTNTDALEASIPPEFLRSIDLPSLPLSSLRLPVGAPVMCLRNLLPEQGLCNGSRGVVTKLLRNSIEIRMLGGDFDGQTRLIPRVLNTTGKEDLPYILTRKQFPLRVCFAITINKSQGQTFDQVGIDLRTPVFSHGQFYVAISRVTDPNGLFILLSEGNTTTDNIIYPEVLQDL